MSVVLRKSVFFSHQQKCLIFTAHAIVQFPAAGNRCNKSIANTGDHQLGDVDISQARQIVKSINTQPDADKAGYPIRLL